MYVNRWMDLKPTLSKRCLSSVRIASGYAGLPPVEVALARAMERTLNASGATPFFLDRSKTPMRLDISFINEVSWAGVKR